MQAAITIFQFNFIMLYLNFLIISMLLFSCKVLISNSNYIVLINFHVV